MICNTQDKMKEEIQRKQENDNCNATHKSTQFTRLIYDM